MEKPLILVTNDDGITAPGLRALIRTMKELGDEPSLRATGTVVEVDHPERGTYLTVGNPIKLSDSPADVRRSPLLGEHTDEILKEVIGLGDDEITAAREEGAI